LDEFVVLHAGQHKRPLAIVSSGGTAVDLERNAVRCLENFSTGLRGAVSVEEFLQRGYAVIHLWRDGSASPYSRVLSQCLSSSAPTGQQQRQPAHHPLSVRTLGSLLRATTSDARIFGEGGGIGHHLEDGEKIVDGNEQDDIVATVLEQDWNHHNSENPSSYRRQDSEIILTRSVARSSRLLRALRERSAVLREGRLLTVRFRTVEEYLGRLELIARSVQDAHCLALFFLAAAVSDFYIPAEEKPEHKIQSREEEENGGDDAGDGATSRGDGDGKDLILRLRPVPKALGVLRSEWAPHGFVVSFKLETDPAVLRTKAGRAMDQYGSHLVIGNLLQSRHEKVWVLSPPTFAPNDASTAAASTADASPSSSSSPSPPPSTRASFVEVARPQPSSFPALDSVGDRNGEEDDGGIRSEEDSLESSIVDFVVQSHFEYISYRLYVGSSSGDAGSCNAADGGGYRAAVRAREALSTRQERLRKRRLWLEVQEWGCRAAELILALGLSYAINSTLQRRVLLARGK
jgi:phosphopantothenate-cysteine ligase